MNKNIWTQRIFGLTEFRVSRNNEKIELEYNQDKYKKVLDYAETNGYDLQRVKEAEFESSGLGPGSVMTISIGDSLFQTSVEQCRRLFYSWIVQEVSPFLDSSTTLVELGCGYGYNLSLFPGHTTVGGEYSRNAVELGQKCGMDVHYFDYYDENTYKFIPENAVVFTVHSLEQIPDANYFLNNLLKQKSKIRTVIHFEPFFNTNRQSLFGLLRNKYIELNDYSRNLYSVLSSSPDVEILKYQEDVFGLNPLNSSNLIVWQFAQ